MPADSQNAWVNDAFGVDPDTYAAGQPGGPGDGGMTGMTPDGAGMSAPGSAPNASTPPAPPSPEDAAAAAEANRKRLEAMDKPLEDDPVGNALAGGIASLGVGGLLQVAETGAVSLGKMAAEAVGHAAVDVVEWGAEKLFGKEEKSSSEEAAPEKGSSDAS